MATKTQEGAYSFLKGLCKDNAAGIDLSSTLEEEQLEEQKEEGEEAGNVGEDQTEIVSKMSLDSLLRCGMSSVVEKSNHYLQLFGDKPGELNSMRIKMLEMKLEIHIMDCGLPWGLYVPVVL